MSKTKMRCITCGKWFQSANAKDVTCPDCQQKARKEKQAARSAPPAASGTISQSGSAPRPVVPPKPKPAASGGHWLDTIQDVKVGQPDQPRPKPSLPTSSRDRGSQERTEQYRPASERGQYTSGGYQGYNDERGRGGRDYREGGQRGPGGYREGGQRGPGGYREGGQRGPGGYREGGQRENDYRSPGSYRGIGGYSIPGSIGQRPRQPLEGPYGRIPAHPGRERFGPGQHERTGGKPRPPKKPAQPKQAQPPKPKREKIPPPAPFTPTAEQIAKVEERYQELATPNEFDGIRTQIAQELSIPRKAVKKIVKDLRDRLGTPSWWEIQSYKGNEAELEAIKASYEPFLPVPPVGVHKEIANKLEMKAGTVYQAIKFIRQELKLPQYNDPKLHESETQKQPEAKAEETPPEPEAVASSAAEQPEKGQPVPAAELTVKQTGDNDNGERAPSVTAIPIDDKPV